MRFFHYSKLPSYELESLKVSANKKDLKDLTLRVPQYPLFRFCKHCERCAYIFPCNMTFRSLRRTLIFQTSRKNHSLQVHISPWNFNSFGSKTLGLACSLLSFCTTQFSIFNFPTRVQFFPLDCANLVFCSTFVALIVI